MPSAENTVKKTFTAPGELERDDEMIVRAESCCSSLATRWPRAHALDHPHELRPVSRLCREPAGGRSRATPPRFRSQWCSVDRDDLARAFAASAVRRSRSLNDRIHLTAAARHLLYAALLPTEPRSHRHGVGFPCVTMCSWWRARRSKGGAAGR